MREKLYVGCLIVLFVLAVVSSMLHQLIFKRQPSEIRSSVQVGNPLIFCNDQEYLATIDDVLVSKQYVYVIYGEAHMVKIYDTEGVYISTIAVSDKNTHNGRMLAYISDDVLYLKTPSELYEFHDNSFHCYYNFHEDATIRNFINANRKYYRSTTDTDGRNYFIKSTSIYRTNNAGQEELFLNRPLWLYLCSFIFPWTLLAIFIIFVLSYARR